MKMNWLEKPIVNSKSWNWIYKRLIYNKFINFIGDELNGNVLEVGCGIGKTTSWLKNRFSRIRITAIDYDEEQVETAKNENAKLKNVRFLQGDATKLKFKNSSFDYVIETNVFHHIENYPKAVKEVYRILKNNGKFYLMDISQYFFGLPLINLLFPPESYLTKNILIDKLEKNNFKIEKSKGRLLFFIAAKKV